MNWSEHFASSLRQTPNGPRTWLSGHFFCATDPTPLLLNGLFSWVDTLREQGVIEQFFFIRYFEGGPHLRLRLLGQPDRLVAEAVPFLEKEAAAYFAQRPSERSPTAPPDWFPNDSVVWIAYEPETERYGGPVAIQWAERQFQASSEASRGAIASAEWTYSRSLGVGLQLHTAYSCYLLDTPAERANFWNAVAANWSAYPLLTSNSAQGTNRIDPQALIDLHTKFEQLFLKQKAVLEPFFDDLWAMLITQSDFDEPWYRAWLSGLRQHRLDLDALAQAGQLKVPTQLNPTASVGRQYLLHSYVHMTNNRLGISNYDEGYLGYLMQRLLIGR